MSDEALLLAYARRGDVASLEAIVSHLSPALAGFVRGYLSEEADVEDVLQETWLRLIRCCASYRGGSARAYLVCLARSVLVDRFRRRGASLLSLDDESSAGVEQIPSAAPTPDAAVSACDRRALVRAAVRGLPEGPRAVLLLRMEAEMTYQEIADELKVPLGTVLTWMRRAVAALKARKDLDETGK